MSAAKRRRLLILVTLMLVFLLASPAMAATSQRVDETEDYVDNSTDVNLPSSLGTHNVFADLQDYGANYDAMQEENTGGGGSGGILVSVKDAVVSDTTTSATLEDVDGLTLSITTGATSDILLLASIQCSGSEAATGEWSIVFDSTSYHSVKRQVDPTNPGNLMLAELIEGKPAGTYTYKIQHSVTAGTLTTENSNIVAVELHNGDGAVPAAHVDVASDTVGNGWADIAGLTVDITLSATSHIWVIMVTSAYFSSNNKDSDWRINIDATPMEAQKRDFLSANQYGVVSLITRTDTPKTAGVYTVKGEWDGAGGATLTGEDMTIIAIAAEANSGADSLDIQKDVVTSDSTTATSIEDITGLSVTANLDDDAHVLSFLTIDSDVSVLDTSAYTTINIDSTDYDVMERGHSSVSQHGSIGQVVRTDSVITGATAVVNGRWYTDSGNTLTGYTVVLTTIVLYAGTTGGGNNYELDLEVGWTAVDFDESIEELAIFPVTGGGWPSEDINVEIWTGSWTNLFTDLTPDTWNNISISSYLTDAGVEIRFLGGTESSDTTQDTWEIDAVLIHTYSLAYSESLYEDIPISESDSTAAGFSRTFYENIPISETDYEQSIFGKFLYEVIAISEDIANTLNAVLTLFEDIGVGESISTAASIIMNLFELIAIAGAIITQKVVQQFLFELIPIAESMTRVLTASITLFEDIVIQATVTTVLTAIRTFYETIALAATVTTQKVVQQFLYEIIGLAESMTRVLTASLNLFEDIVIQATLANTGTFIRTFFETIPIAATVSANKFIQKFLFETIPISTTIGTVLAASRTFYEVIPISETVTRNVSYVRTLFEDIAIYATVDPQESAAGVDYTQDLFEVIGLLESDTRVGTFVIVLFESIPITATITTLFSGDWIMNLYEVIAIGTNDPSQLFDYPDMFTGNPPGQRRPPIIILPIIPPNLVMAGLGTGYIIYHYFYGVPYIEESKSTATVRRAKLKSYLDKYLVNPLLGRRRKASSKVFRTRSRLGIRRKLEKVWRMFWKES